MKKDERALIDAVMIWHAVNVITGSAPDRRVDKKLTRAALKLLRGSGWTSSPKRAKAKRGAK